MGNQHGKEKKDFGKKIYWTDAEAPSPPGKPYLVADPGEKYTDVITITWSPPVTDGGAPIVGYIVEHKRTGSPHWLRATPHLVDDTLLALTGLEPGWRYQFRVSAENEVGRSEPGDLSEPFMVTPQKWAACAPFFHIDLQDQTGLENDKIEFKVQVFGVPPPSISWYKDGFEVFSSRRTKIVTENEHSAFIIHQAALEDEGEIKCTATNRAGHAVTKAILKLEAPPRIRLPKQYEDGLIFEKGELIRVKVTVAGRPRPQITWYHNGEIFQKSERAEIIYSETGSIVKITNACRSDRGEYMIKGVNKIGEDMAGFLITVTDCPSPPGKVQVITIGRTVTLSWSAPEDDGGCKIGTYIIEYFRVGWDMWLKAKNSRQLTTILEKLIEGSQYKFRVRAENPYGISEPSEESDLVFIPDIKRGILKPETGTENKVDVLNVLKETQNLKEIVKEENGKTVEQRNRRLLEEKAKLLLDTPLSELLPYGKRKAELVSSSEENLNLPPPVPKRKSKKKNKESPSPVSTASLLSDSCELTSSLINEGPSKFSSADISSASSEGRFGSDMEIINTPNSERRKFFFKNSEQNDFTSPMYPRDNDDSISHGSSELMLVLYPKEGSKSIELSLEQRLEIEKSLTEKCVAPPISLSAPELGATDFFEQPLIRNAVSSSELLYEKTAARLYQNSLEEEAKSVVKRRYSMDRKSVERRPSLKEPLLDRRLSFKETQIKEEDVKVKENSQNKKAESQLNNSKTEHVRERLSSVEKERLEFALVREKLRKQQEEKRNMLNNQQLSDTTTTTPTSSSLGTEDLEEEDEFEDDELDSEEDYLDRNKKNVEEQEEEEEGDLDLYDILKDPRISNVTVTPLKPRKMAPFAEQEDDTYHPRSMIPTRSVMTKLEKSPELKLSVLSPPITSSLQAESPQPSPTLEEPVTPPKIPKQKQTKLKKTSKLLKKFGLKKEKKVPKVMVTPADPNQPPPPRPILKHKDQTKEKLSPLSVLKFGKSRSSDKSMSEEESESDFPGKKKKVRIAEPNEEKAIQEEQKKIDENAVGNQVLIFHYSGIVKEFGGNKRQPSKLCLNYEELKARANSEEKIEKKTFPEPVKKQHQNSIRTEVKTERVMEKTNPMTASAQQTNEPSSSLSLSLSSSDFPKSKSAPQRHTSLDYITDIAMFLVACWLYLFKNELYAIPVLCIMAYRQLKDITVRNYVKLKTIITNKLPEKFTKKKSENDDKSLSTTGDSLIR